MTAQHQASTIQPGTTIWNHGRRLVVKDTHAIPEFASWQFTCETVDLPHMPAVVCYEQGQEVTVKLTY